MLTTAVVAVGSTPTALTAPEAAGSDAVTVIVSHTTTGVTVYLGDQSVTTGNGYPLLAGAAPLTINLRRDEALYAVVTVGSVNVNVLRVGVT